MDTHAVRPFEEIAAGIEAARVLERLAAGLRARVRGLTHILAAIDAAGLDEDEMELYGLNRAALVFYRDRNAHAARVLQGS